jgi:hypothetical protein
MDSVLAPDISTFLIPNVHLTGGIASGLGALLDPTHAPPGQDRFLIQGMHLTG